MNVPVNKFIITCFFVFCFALQHTAVSGQTLKVAIAANLQPVIKALQADFKTKTRISTDAISGASGKLTAQIKNGAPFDVFLSADVAFPADLFKTGFATKAPVVYADGVLIMCSTRKLGAQPWARLLTSPGVKRVAIANPSIAPYGKAAAEALTHEGILKKMNGKLVTGESISQVNTYISTGVVDAGFTTLSFYKENSGKQQLNMWTINPKTYSPIQQGMIILKHGAGKAAAQQFYKYILSPAAKKIFIKYGYHVQ
ncbi:molybdate ABC transporter substrate-binding protein [Mucilaginibacter sp.]|uniref:molybdate ABC transporter substrate-binding protein n=1 Tax=Mucilaginibacter sp. TaxID=1882438 RepID=UPI0035BC02FE